MDAGNPPGTPSVHRFTFEKPTSGYRSAFGG
jgi:hypothetical protein